ncbi:Diphosphomevalonate decarboxylase [Atractiella rhizophila]|nr:Diphosphomevalonate decarboxylase [Atractiella rhizophila]
MATKEVTCCAPVNIAVIKYWGKRSLPLNLPTNSSLSVTLSVDDLASTTTARVGKWDGGDKLWLNGAEEGITGRTRKCLEWLREERKKLEDANKDLEVSFVAVERKLSDLTLHICSKNNFPTAAGLASSASGFAALSYTISVLYELTPDPNSVAPPTSNFSLSSLSRIARLGSGSACRSVFGGYVAWEMGAREDGEDSIAVQVANEEYWPEMRALILVVSDAKKGVGSTVGMQKTVETSPLIQHRIEKVVPERMEIMKRAIKERDFETFAEVTMRDSNDFHAVCLDTWPPIFYMNDVSRAIIKVVHELNRVAGRSVAAYTFDAGPNAVLYTLEKDVDTVFAAVEKFFPGEGRGAGTLLEGFEQVVPVQEKNAVSRVIKTKVGTGPRVLSASAGLLNAEGYPKELK